MKKLLFLIFFITNTLVTLGQNSAVTAQLGTVLKQIEKKYQLSFSYLEKVVTNKTVEIDDKLELDQLLLEITLQTDLYFQKITDTQYNIIPIHHTNEQQISQLEKILIHSYITAGIDKNDDGSIQLTSKSLGILPGLVNPDLAQSMQLVPGISTLDESATGIQVRGGSPDQNLILFDGIKLYNTGYFYGMYSAFNPAATQSARIYKSGTSAAYGERISGIIDISTGEDIPKKIEGGFGIDGLTADAFVKIPIDNQLALYTFGRSSYANLWKTPTHNAYADKILTNFGDVFDTNGNKLVLETDDDFSPETSNHNLSFTDFNNKIIYKPNKHNHFSLSSLFTENTMQFDFKGGDELVLDSLKTNNKGVNFKWTHTGQNKQKTEINVYYSEYNSRYQNDEWKDETGNGVLDRSEINIRQNDIVDIGFQLANTQKLNDKNQLSIGYQVAHTDLDVVISKTEPFENANNSNNQDNENLKNVLFGEHTYFFNKKSLISTGVRLAHYASVKKVVLEPRVNFEYSLTKSLRFKTAIERRNQPISQLVEFNHSELRLENNLWRLSDDTQFPLLTSNQISGGFLFHKGKLNIDVDAYYKTLDGLTTLTNGFSNQLGISNNPIESSEVGSSAITGLDVLVRYKLNNYKAWLGYTYNDITFEFPNLENTPNTFPGNNDIKHQFRISNTYKLNNWQFSLGWQFRSGKPITPVNSYNIQIDADGEPAGVVRFGSINSSRLPDFHRLDASILYDLKLGENKAQIGISFLNLYDRVIPLNRIYKSEVKPLDDGGIPIDATQPDSFENRELILEQVIQRFSLGFTPNVSFRVWF